MLPPPFKSLGAIFVPASFSMSTNVHFVPPFDNHSCKGTTTVDLIISDGRRAKMQSHRIPLSPADSSSSSSSSSWNSTLQKEFEFPHADTNNNNVPKCCRVDHKVTFSGDGKKIYSIVIDERSCRYAHCHEVETGKLLHHVPYNIGRAAPRSQIQQHPRDMALDRHERFLAILCSHSVILFDAADLSKDVRHVIPLVKSGPMWPPLSLSRAVTFLVDEDLLLNEEPARTPWGGPLSDVFSDPAEFSADEKIMVSQWCEEFDNFGDYPGFLQANDLTSFSTAAAKNEAGSDPSSAALTEQPLRLDTSVDHGIFFISPHVLLVQTLFEIAIVHLPLHKQIASWDRGGEEFSICDVVTVTAAATDDGRPLTVIAASQGRRPVVGFWLVDLKNW